MTNTTVNRLGCPLILIRTCSTIRVVSQGEPHVTGHGERTHRARVLARTAWGLVGNRRTPRTQLRRRTARHLQTTTQRARLKLDSSRADHDAAAAIGGVLHRYSGWVQGGERPAGTRSGANARRQHAPPPAAPPPAAEPPPGMAPPPARRSSAKDIVERSPRFGIVMRRFSIASRWGGTNASVPRARLT